MALKVKDVRLTILNMRTRMPFRYGIATLTALPHLFVTLVLEENGKSQKGIASDGLPPKWFTKDPEADFRDEVEDMMNVVESAGEIARHCEPASTIFDLWNEIYTSQEQRYKDSNHPPLLWGFGVTLIERALIDAYCRMHNRPFANVLRDNELGIRLNVLHDELGNSQPSDYLPPKPLNTIQVRHTVGLSDPLHDSDIPVNERLNDGLPQSLENCIKTYGLRFFKIKICADLDTDIERLKKIAEIVRAYDLSNFYFTLDGNEQFKSIDQFKHEYEAIISNPVLEKFFQHVLFIEQPLHRNVALNGEIKAGFEHWPDRPPFIIDESDATLGTAKEALTLGYQGTSHKNCKGIFKGIANACLIQKVQQERGGKYILSGEDLANVGPVALLQDLTTLANLGISHAERNGHHYFAGLSMFDKSVQQQVLSHHADLYAPHANGFAALNIQRGEIKIDSILQSPYGLAFDLDTSRYTPREDWRFDTLIS